MCKDILFFYTTQIFIKNLLKICEVKIPLASAKDRKYNKMTVMSITKVINCSE